MLNKHSEKSNVALKSNLMVKSRISSRGWVCFAPAELLIKLHPEYRDSRTDVFLSQQQLEQKKKAMFVAEKIVDID